MVFFTLHVGLGNAEVPTELRAQGAVEGCCGHHKFQTCGKGGEGQNSALASQPAFQTMVAVVHFKYNYMHGQRK